MSDEPKRIYIGSFEPGLNVLVVPKAAIAPAEAVLDAAHAHRETLAIKARLQVQQQAKARSKLKKAMRSVFGFRRRGR